MTTGRPGVYITERLLPAPITTTANANAAGACVGEFAQGPSTVTLVRSWYDFTKTFGGYNLTYPATIGVGEFFKNGGTELYVRRVLGSGASRGTVVITKTGTGTAATVTAKEYGTSSNDLRVTVTLARTVDSVNYYNLVVTREQTLGSTTSSVLTDDVVLETFYNVRFDAATAGATSSPDFAESVINVDSSQISIVVDAASTTPIVGTYALAGASDGTAPTKAQYTTALDDFLYIDRPLVMFAPEVHQVAALGLTDGRLFQVDLAAWATANNGFAVIDTPPALTVGTTASPGTVLTHSAAIGAKANAAVYYPNIYIADPLGRSATSIRLVGPAGSVAGLYLATDALRGPYKAPAGIQAGIGTAVATERQFTSTELDLLNSYATPVNPLRNLPGSGVVVMGARTLLQDGTANRYVSMRRSLIYIRKQLEDIAQFALFENNDERLWARLRTAIGIFLNDYRNQGGLRGTTPAEAYFVKCDAENNSETDIAAGEVNVEVGVALEYPAEFVVITLSQKTVS